MTTQYMQIGEVAELTGLSLRTIRYYEEMGLVTPSARSGGGFRLYTEADLRRLLLIRRMKPLDFTLDEMRDLLTLLDGLESGDGDRAHLLERLATFRADAESRVVALRHRLEIAEGFASDLGGAIARHLEPPSRDD